MKIETSISLLEKNGIPADKICTTSDQELLKVPGIGKTALLRLREKFGPEPQKLTPSLSDEVAKALGPVLLKRSGVGKGQVRALARMVAAYFD